jgi:hypothetical protein
VITEFQLMFLADNSGLPGTVLQAYTIAGNAGETFVGSASTFFDYSYSVNLPAPFNAGANTKYWLSIQPTVDFPPQWFWRAGTGGDSQSAEIILSVSPDPVLLPEDSAFSLKGTPVPEPSTLGSLGIGLSLLAFAAWRRSR